MRLKLLLLFFLIFPVAAIALPGKLEIQATPPEIKVGESVEFIVKTELREAVPMAEIKVAKVMPGETVESVIDAISQGRFGAVIGYTDSNGRLRYRFDDWGYYVVYASKEGYLGTFTTVNVKPIGYLHIDITIGDWISICKLEELATMNVEEALKKCGDEVALIVKVTDDYGNPIGGAKVKIKGFETIQLTSDAKGEARATVKVGTYIITAEKAGYAPGFEFEGVKFSVTLDNIKEKIREKIEEAKSKVFATNELEGVVINPSHLAKTLRNFAETKRDLVSKMNLNFEDLKTYILLSKEVRAILLSAKEIPEAKVKVRGFGLGAVDYRGYEWVIFLLDPREEPKIIDRNGIPVTVNSVLRNPESYKFELLNFSTHCRELALTLLEEEMNLAIPVSVGYLADTETTSFSFLERIIENAGKFNRSERFSREFIDEILDFRSTERLAVFGIKPSYWFDADCFAKGVLLDLSNAHALLSLMPQNAILVIPPNAQFVVLEIEKIAKAELVTLEDVIKKPQDYSGKLLAFESIGVGFNISTNQLIESSARATGQSELIAVAEANPIDVLIQAEARWYPVVPSRFQIAPVVGALSYEEPKPAIEVIDERKISVIYGYVLTAERFGFEYPVIVVQDKKFEREVQLAEIKAEIKEQIDKIREKIKKRVEEGVMVGIGLEKPKFFQILPVLEPEKSITIEVGRVVEKIKLNAKERAENVFLKVRELAILPENVPKPSGKVYVFLEIEVSVEAADGEVEFKVSKKWLVENSLEKSSIKLEKYVEAYGWITLETNLTSEDSDYVYYSAKIPGFSLFAVTAKSEKITTTAAAPKTLAPQTPGFEVALAVSALLTIAYFFKKRN